MERARLPATPNNCQIEGIGGPGPGVLDSKLMVLGVAGGQDRVHACLTTLNVHRFVHFLSTFLYPLKSRSANATQTI